MTTLINARIFDGRRLLDGTHSLRIADGAIAAIHGQPAPDVPQGEQVVDLAGKTLMPGLITSHLHADFYRFTLAAGMAGEPLGKEFPPGVMMAIGIRTCRVLLESGFTGYAGASCSNHIDAQLKMAIAEGIVPGPRIRPCGHHIGTTADLNDIKRWWRHELTSGTDIFGDGPEELRKIVREEVRHGAEIIKIFASAGHGFPGRTVRNMAKDEIAAIVEAAHGRGVRVRAHVADKAMIMECIALGVDIIDHGDMIDDEVIGAMVEAGTFWVPSLVYPKMLMDLNWGYPDTRALFDNVVEMLPAADRAGVRILVGDDYSGVFRDLVPDDPLDHQVGRYGREFAFYRDLTGIAPERLLSWGTANPGQLLADPPATLGVVEQGALADLIVVAGNPVEDLSILARPQQYLKAVIRDGEFVINHLDGGA